MKKTKVCIHCKQGNKNLSINFYIFLEKKKAERFSYKGIPFISNLL